MDLAARPHITAGVALASAAVIAVAPATQHLPDLHLAQQLPQVSVSDIQLTDASSTIDLFAGVASQLASLVTTVGNELSSIPGVVQPALQSFGTSAITAAVPANVLNSVESWLPIQTWNAFANHASNNLSWLAQKWAVYPFPVANQIGANWLQYGNEYVTPYHSAATAAVAYFTGTKPGNFGPLISNAMQAMQKGQVSTVVTDLYSAFFSSPFVQIGEPLEKIPPILAQIAQNMANTVNYATNGFLVQAGATFGILTPGTIEGAVGTALQNIFTSFAAGDPSGLATNIINAPGLIADQIVNGTFLSKNVPLNGGLISAVGNNSAGLFKNFGVTVPQQLAGVLVTPGAQNILQGGSLANAGTTFVNTLTQGWPALGNYLAGVPTQLTAMLQSLPTALPAALNGLVGAASGFVSQLGVLLVNLLKLL
ncbi:hypothetical protein H7H82_08320 [Mycobacterium heidelbergense]|uniref:hypothetical protein n=1 Tax=Mycobacterium heidelbergense TaxID=53376 RepID=UPI001154A279|nr:hypothetical protein [Mycobacterium heidelbergense]MCV7050599.1 hypothetical protein [Mycobacterium heidelbergense]BBZ50608.1 hypothetical protein MHEI_23250 [Mycobacterium heidelbergense]